LASIMVVDDDSHIAELLSRLVARKGHDVTRCTDSVEAREKILNGRYDLIITDLFMPEVDGLQLSQAALEHDPEIMVIVVTGHATLESGLSALRLGVYDFILKPFKNQEVEYAVKRALESRALRSENRVLRRKLANKDDGREMVGNSRLMMQVYSIVERAAPTRSTVLITGESGTGKELAARAIHRNSSRRRAPFICVNCAAIPENLLESDLFGHRKGAFTDAQTNRVGRFVKANGGTLFLDEIGAMPAQLQVKLLRVLQERKVMPVGAEKTVDVDVRILAATNADLKQKIQVGEFREDLFYRLNVIQITMPPLRDRRDDIGLLIKHFVDKHSGLLGVEPKTFSVEALHLMQRYAWPGNVRELENAVESCLALSVGRDPIRPEELPQEISGMIWGGDTRVDFHASHIDLGKTLRDFERQILSQALEASGGVKSRAARLLNIKRTTLIEKIKRLGLNA